MNAIKILNLAQKITKYKDLTINDVNSKELVQGPAEKFYSKDLENFKFLVGATGEIRVELYNSLDDEDDLGVIGKIIPIKDTHGFIKYIADGQAKLMGSSEGKKHNFSLIQQKGATYSLYKIHPLTEKIHKAIEKDLSKFISVLDLSDSDVTLGVEEAAALHVDGQLEAKVSLSYSDVFLSSLNGLSKLLHKNELIKIQFKPDITLDFNIDISDTFTVVFHRNSEEQYTVLIKKSDIRQFGGSVKAGIQVSFVNPDQVNKVFNDLLEKLLETSEEKINEIISKSKFTDLSKSQKDLLEILLDKFGLEHVTDKIDALKGKYSELKEKLEDTITNVAKANVELGFRYEYQQISTKNILFQGKFNRAAFKKYHFNMLSGNLKEIVDSHKNNNPDDIEVEHFLQESQKKRRKAWGFSMGFASTSTKEEIEDVVRKNTKGEKQVTFSGNRKYENSFFGNKTSWEVDFNVEMPVFSSNETPLASEFDYSLYLAIEWKDKKLNKKEDLLEFLDQGVLWSAIPQGEIINLADEFYPKMKRDTLTVTSQLKLSPYAFKQLLNRMIILNERNDIIGRALGAAMPYDQDHDIKRNIELRSKYYGQVWRHYLENPIHGNDDYYVSFTYKTLKAVSPELAKRERRGNKETREETTRLNNNTDNEFNKFKKGIQRLHTGIHQPSPYSEVIKQSYQEIRAFWSLPFYTRALGYYLLYIASDRPDILDEMERIFTISYQGEGGKEEIINLTTHL